jgi:hypothetical protein
LIERTEAYPYHAARFHVHGSMVSLSSDSAREERDMLDERDKMNQAERDIRLLLAQIRLIGGPEVDAALKLAYASSERTKVELEEDITGAERDAMDDLNIFERGELRGKIRARTETKFEAALDNFIAVARRSLQPLEKEAPAPSAHEVELEVAE